MNPDSAPEAPTVSAQRFDEWPEAASIRGAQFIRCVFGGVDAAERQTSHARFDGCEFFGVRLNGSRHRLSAFVNCRFNGVNFFEAQLDRCKLLGSEFVDVRWDGIHILEGDWSYVGLRLARLAGADFHGARLCEAVLREADLTGADLRGADLTRAVLAKARLGRADLRGARLDGIDFRQVDLTGVRFDMAQAVRVVEGLGARVE